jgi:hypothetical protein
MRLKVITIGMLWFFLLWGCAAIQREKIPAESIIPELKWNLSSYAEFVKENMAEMNANYSSVYAPYEFIVDTDYGSTVIQNLLDTESATSINAGLVRDANPEPSEPLMRIYQHITNHYDYILDPLKWQKVEETIRTQKGDCKSLSLLLMSCLANAGYNTYAGISNGQTPSTAFPAFTKIRFTRSIRIDPKKDKELTIRKHIIKRIFHGRFIR